MKLAALAFLILAATADPVSAPSLDCRCPPPGQVLVPREIAAQFFQKVNGLEEALLACDRVAEHWRTRNDCS